MEMIYFEGHKKLLSDCFKATLLCAHARLQTARILNQLLVHRLLIRQFR
jgi:hypothetical protein